MARVASKFILLTKPITDYSNLPVYVHAVSALCQRVPNEQLQFDCLLGYIFVITAMYFLIPQNCT